MLASGWQQVSGKMNEFVRNIWKNTNAATLMLMHYNGLTRV